MTDAIRSTRLRRRRDETRPATAARHRIPNLSPLTALLAESGHLDALVDGFRKAASGRVGRDLRHVTYAALPHGAKTYLAAAVAVASGERLVWIARDAEIADRVAEELGAWLGGAERVVTLQARTALAYERSELVRDESAARVAALAEWRREGSAARILVASLQALFQRTLAPDDIPSEPLRLSVRTRLAMDRVVGALVDLGYEHVPEVGGRGEFARRGGIVDVFPAGQPMPVRIEWFGDEIDSLRAFDPADQRGVGSVEEAVLLPASEFLLGASVRDELVERMNRTVERLPEGLQSDLGRFDSGALGDAAELWGGYLAPHTALDHLGPAIWLVDEPDEVSTVAEFLQTQAEERRDELERAGELPARWATAYPTAREWKTALHEARTLELTWESEIEGAPPGGNPFGWHEPVMPPAPIGDLAATVRRWRSQGARVVLASDQSARLSEILEDDDQGAAPLADLHEVVPAGGFAIIERSLNGGFAGGPDDLAFITDRELFGSVRVRRPRAMRRVVPRDLLERLEPGDVVVHVDHGVARYDGLVRRAAAGSVEERDYLELRFAEKGRIWVPVEQIERVSRYAGGDHPQLSKLGGGEWQRARTRVKKAVGDLARDLLRLYADRAKAHGRSFGEDTPWQSEMEAAFPYEETPDQLRAAIDVKADLEKASPMDRLVVGDVGYGKTEVALRAAFKAIQAGTQVAVLVPTTVLAAQHLVTFQQRFAAYPVTVRSLSRFVPRARTAGHAQGTRGRHRRHRHRHASIAEQGHRLP